MDIITTPLSHPTHPHSNTSSVELNGNIGTGLAVALKSGSAVPIEVYTHSPRLRHYQAASPGGGPLASSSPLPSVLAFLGQRKQYPERHCPLSGSLLEARSSPSFQP